MRRQKKKAQNCFVYKINYIPRLKTLKIMRYSLINILHIYIRGRKGWLEKTWRSVVGKRACSLFQLRDSITVE